MHRKCSSDSDWSWKALQHWIFCWVFVCWRWNVAAAVASEMYLYKWVSVGVSKHSFIRSRQHQFCRSLRKHWFYYVNVLLKGFLKTTSSKPKPANNKNNTKWKQWRIEIQKNQTHIEWRWNISSSGSSKRWRWEKTMHRSHYGSNAMCKNANSNGNWNGYISNIL